MARMIERPGASRIGILSDTHVPERMESVPGGIQEALDGVDLILHAGDISTPPVLNELGEIAEVLAVQGNNRGDRTLFHPPLPDRLTVRAKGGFSIGVYHGFESLYQVVTDLTIRQLGYRDVYAGWLRKRIRTFFTGVHCIVYGHIHWPFIQMEDEILFINPGRSFGKKESSCAILEIGEERARVTLLPLGAAGRLAPFLSGPRSFPIPGM